MARLFPNEIDAISASAPLEAATAIRLRDELPDGWLVIHACHWTLPAGRKIGQGEIDLVVLSPGGTLCLIEQKNGTVTVEGEEYVKHYGLHRKSVSQQMGRARHAVMTKLGQSKIEARAVVSLLYVPNVELVRVRGLGIDELSIVDATEADALASRVERLLRCEPPNPDLVRSLRNFFAGELDFRPSLHALKASSVAAQVRLSGPLRLLLEGFSMRPMRLCIEACAGAGKSEFIRQLAERNVTAGRRTLVLCYNRPLAGLLREALPSPVVVDTFYGFRRRVAEALGVCLVFPPIADQVFWDALEVAIESGVKAAGGLPEGWRFDAILVDEAQDLDDEALELIRAHLVDGGDFVWVGDPDQRRQQSSSVAAAAGYAYFQLHQNFRTPKGIAREIVDLAPPGTLFRNPVEGTGLRMIQIGAAQEAHEIDQEIQRLLVAGHTFDDLILLDLGNIASQERFNDRIGELTLCRFTGRYRSDGEQIMTGGELLYDTIWRFKGQQRAHVIVVGVSAKSLQESRMRRALYVALTRATVGASLVLIA